MASFAQALREYCAARDQYDALENALKKKKGAPDADVVDANTRRTNAAFDALIRSPARSVPAVVKKTGRYPAPHRDRGRAVGNEAGHRRNPPRPCETRGRDRSRRPKPVPWLWWPVRRRSRTTGSTTARPTRPLIGRYEPTYARGSCAPVPHPPGFIEWGFPIKGRVLPTGHSDASAGVSRSLTLIFN